MGEEMNLQELMWVKEKLAELEARLERLEAEKLPGDPETVAAIIEKRRPGRKTEADAA
jgi:BMFP domain-containing protein YqiC